MTLTFNLDQWAPLGIGLGFAILSLRHFAVILAAEQGRKQDLVKRSYKSGQEFQLSILIPFIDPNDHPALLQLLHAIHQQEYPAAKVAVHLVASEECAQDLIPQSLRPNVKVWRHPLPSPRYEQAIGWLIERCLAAGGNGMLVFLKPTDMIKPDFFQNVAAKGIDHFVVQGYVALKNRPETMVEKSLALATRVWNRIENAGRFHLGMSSQLLDSGWAIKQDVLEMIPYHRGLDVNNLEYTLRLNLENFRVCWAPSMVVYSDAPVSQPALSLHVVGAFFNRLNLLSRYGARLFSRFLLRFDLNSLDNLFSIIRPPYFFSAAFLVGLTLFSFFQTGPTLGNAMFLGGLTIIALVLHVVALVVARCKASDYWTMLGQTPLNYLLNMALMPLGLLGVVRLKLSSAPERKGAYYRQRQTRFNEDIAGPPDLFDDRHGQQIIRTILKKNAPDDEDALEEALPSPQPLALPDFSASKREEVTFEPAQLSLANLPLNELLYLDKPELPVVRLPRETVKAVLLSNGKNQVDCRLKTYTTFDENNLESYQLTLVYKTASFSTASYRILDQAFYELHAKLSSRGLTLLTCGSCGNFYNPTADVPGALKNSGVCLFDKLGKEVSLSTDAVTVTSVACDYHCSLEKREAIVRQWKESLSYSRVR